MSGDRVLGRELGTDREELLPFTVLKNAMQSSEYTFFCRFGGFGDFVGCCVGFECIYARLIMVGDGVGSCEGSRRRWKGNNIPE
jgi:hypothetical protein